MKTFLKYIFIFLTFNVITIYSQLTYEPLDNKIYDFLSRVNYKGLIEFDDYVKPLGRKYISSKLSELISKSELLTSLEQEELKFYSKEYGVELDTSKSSYRGNLTLFGMDQYKIWRPFSYKNSYMYLDVNPIVGYEKGKWDDIDYDLLQLGAYMKGALGNVLGFSFRLRQFRLEPGFNNKFFFRFTNTSVRI